jgi:SAM-dependent methyltransferase
VSDRAWSAADGSRTTAPEPPAQGSYYGPIGDWQGAGYERNAFTAGTAQEVAFLVDVLRIEPGELVVDVGCGTGRHSRSLAERGIRAVGVDLSAGLLGVAAGRGGEWVRADARRLPLRSGCADVAVSLCQGGFGITPGADELVLAELARVLRPGARLALTAFSLAFAARWLAPGDAFDVDRGLVHTVAEVRGPDARERRFDLWTQCYSAGHLRHLAATAGLAVDSVSGVEPGDYGLRAPTLGHPELLLLARRLPAPPPRPYSG